MPIYQYLCGDCDHRWEREQPAGDPPVKECPACRKLRARRLWSPAAHPDTTAANPTPDDKD